MRNPFNRHSPGHKRFSTSRIHTKEHGAVFLSRETWPRRDISMHAHFIFALLSSYIHVKRVHSLKRATRNGIRAWPGTRFNLIHLPGSVDIGGTGITAGSLVPAEPAAHCTADSWRMKGSRNEQRGVHIRWAKFRLRREPRRIGAIWHLTVASLLART